MTLDELSHFPVYVCVARMFVAKWEWTCNIQDDFAFTAHNTPAKVTVLEGKLLSARCPLSSGIFIVAVCAVSNYGCWGVAINS